MGTRGRVARGLLVALCGAAALGGGGAVAEPAGAPQVAADPAFRLFGPQYMNRDDAVTLQEALDDAREFDVILAKTKIYAPWISQMRAVNPDLVVTAYSNATMAAKNQLTTFPDSWYVKDRDGVKVRSKYGLPMMDVENPGWRQNRVQECQSLITSSGYDGCVLDIMGPGPATPPFGAEGQVDREPVNPRTGRAWTQQEFMAGTNGVATQIAQAVAPKVVWGNGIGHGARYFQFPPTSVLWDSTDTMIAEGFLRSGRAPLHAISTTEWQQNIDMIRDSEARGRTLLLTTKVWTDAPQAEKDRWHLFSMGTYLLATEGLSRWVFLFEEAGDQMDHQPQWDAAERLGTPRGAAFVNARGLHQRNFTGGRVLVNPGTSTISQKLTTPLTDLDGRPVSRVTLPPQSGAVLLKAS